MKKFSELREEIQQLDELSKQTLRRYVKAASGDVGGKRAAIKLLGDKNKQAKGIIGKDVKKREAFIGMASAKVPNAPNRPKKKSAKAVDGEGSSVSVRRQSRPSSMTRARAMAAKTSEDHDKSAKGVAKAAKSAVSKTKAVVKSVRGYVRTRNNYYQNSANSSDNLRRSKASNKQRVAKPPKVRVRKPPTPRKVKKLP